MPAVAIQAMNTLDRDPMELQEVEGFNSSDNASVPSAVTGNSPVPQNLGQTETSQLKKQKKRKSLAQRLAPKKIIRQTVSGVKDAADKVESLVRGDSWTRKHRTRRSSVDPVKMAADTAYRRRTKDLETVVCLHASVCSFAVRRGFAPTFCMCTHFACALLI